MQTTWVGMATSTEETTPLAGLGQSAERFARILTLGSLSLWSPLEIKVGPGRLGQ